MRILTFCILAFGIPAIHSGIFDTIFKIVKIRGQEVVEKAIGNTRCASDLKIFLKDLIQRKSWALQMLDASGKPPSGLLTANMFIGGNFDECLNIHEGKNDTVIDGQYCTVVLTPSSEFSNGATSLLDISSAAQIMGVQLGLHAEKVIKLMKFTYGVCIPTSCTIGNLQAIWNHIEHRFQTPVHINFEDVLCRSKDKSILPWPVDSYILAAFGIYILIIIASTLYDLFIHQMQDDTNEQQGNYLTAFSLYTNAKKLFSYSLEAEDGVSLKCISGIKVLSMMWIIFGHRMLINMFFPNINAKHILEWLKLLEATPVLAASFAVDTFFVVSGFLLTYLFLKNQNLVEERGLPIIPFYIYRIFRLTPALAATILFYIGLFKKLGDGPVWSVVSRKISGSCYKNWFHTLFFASNTLPMHEHCIEQSWYLAVDTQLYFISPFIFKNLLKYPSKTIWACILSCLISSLYSYVITIQNNYGSIFYEGDADFYKYIYLPTFVRMPPWLIGIILGYFIFRFQQVIIPKFLSMILWVFSFSTLVFLILIHTAFPRNDYDPVRSAVFNSCARPTWALAISTIIFLCVTGHGGRINKFLSLAIFQVLARLTYSIYLIHVGLLAYLMGQTKVVGYFSYFNSIHEFLGDYVLTIVVATVWCLSFETPFINISKIFMKKDISGPAAIDSQERTQMFLKKKRNKKNYVVCLYSSDKLKIKKIK